LSPLAGTGSAAGQENTMPNRRTKAQRRQLNLIRESIFAREVTIQAQIRELTQELDELAEADQALLGVM
jgi:CRISPR/Cas system-associated endoribonuclease Cas2